MRKGQWADWLGSREDVNVGQRRVTGDVYLIYTLIPRVIEQVARETPLVRVPSIRDRILPDSARFNLCRDNVLMSQILSLTGQSKKHAFCSGNLPM